jgi:hypothetical protein
MTTPGVLLIGGVPLPDAETVFRTVSETVGPYLDRIPGGETGEHGRWSWFQDAMLERHPFGLPQRQLIDKEGTAS